MINNIKNAQQTMERLYLDRNQTGDITFLVESQRIRAHRNILAAHSQKYKSQFYGPCKVQGEIQVSNVSAATFNVFLQFFYKETIDLTMDNVGMVLGLAKQSFVDELVETCVNFLNDAIVANKLFVPYHLSNLHDIESLRLACEQRISTNTKDIFASEDFLECDRDMLLWILKMDSMNCTEKDVFTACIAWARAQCKRDNLDDENPENLRTALDDAIYLIRFSSINAEEFADLHKSMEGFFTADEINEISKLVNNSNSYEPQMFNSMKRTSKNKTKESRNEIAEQSVVWILEFDRFISQNKLPKFINVNGKIHFVFHCSNQIRLHGFTLGMHFNQSELDTFPKTITYWAICGNARQTQFEVKCKVFPSTTKNDETVMMFEKPIDGILFFSCNFQPPPIKLKYKLVLHATGLVDNIGLSFEGSKWVTQIFFDKI